MGRAFRNLGGELWAAKAFQRRESHCEVPYEHVESGVKLGVWLGRQRKRYGAWSLSEAERKAKKVSPMTDQELRRLEELGVK